VERDQKMDMEEIRKEVLQEERYNWKPRYLRMLMYGRYMDESIEQTIGQAQGINKRTKDTFKAISLAWKAKMNSMIEESAKEKAKIRAEVDKRQIMALELTKRTLTIEQQNEKLEAEVERIKADTDAILTIDPPMNALDEAILEGEEVDMRKAMCREMEKEVLELQRQIEEYEEQIMDLDKQTRLIARKCKDLSVQVARTEDSMLRGAPPVILKRNKPWENWDFELTLPNYKEDPEKMPWLYENVHIRGLE